jgi:hypothetical protein
MEDRRGVNGTPGRCITVGDARRQVPGVEWQGRPWADMFPVHPAPVLPPQRDATDRWVWQYQANQPGCGGGDIYDGAWGAIKDIKPRRAAATASNFTPTWDGASMIKILENDASGLALMWNADDDHRGLVCKAQYVDGQVHGKGQSWWLPDSATWQTNQLSEAARSSRLSREWDYADKPYSFDGQYSCDEKVAGKLTFKHGASISWRSARDSRSPRVPAHQHAGGRAQKRRKAATPSAGQRGAAHGSSDGGGGGCPQQCQRNPACVRQNHHPGHCKKVRVVALAAALQPSLVTAGGQAQSEQGSDGAAAAAAAAALPPAVAVAALPPAVAVAALPPAVAVAALPPAVAVAAQPKPSAQAAQGCPATVATQPQASPPRGTSSTSEPPRNVFETYAG